MLIDWFTVCAQALNFLILVWLMKRYLYKPVLAAIDAREKRIAGELTAADAKKADAQKEHDTFQQKNEEFDKQRATLLSKVTDEANAERQRLLDAARKAADALSAKRQEALRNEAHALDQALRHRTQQEVFAITRKALADLATTSLEACMGELFMRRLGAMDGPAKQALGTALKSAPGPVSVRSAFDLPPEQRATIQNALNVTFSADIPLRFETTPDLISGFELAANGQKVAWSLDDYLNSLEKGVDALLKENDAPKPAPSAVSKANDAPKPNVAAPVPESATASKPEVAPAPKPETATVPAPVTPAPSTPAPETTNL